MTRAKLTFAILAAALMAAIVTQQMALRRSRGENSALQQEIASLRAPAPTPQPAVDTNELERLRAEHEELVRLRGQVAQLRRERDDLQRKINSLSTATNKTAATAPAANDAWVQQILTAPTAQQGAAAGAIRGKALKDGQSVSASELALIDALKQRELNSLERTPAEFAEFQSAFIQSVVGLSDPDKARQIHDLILRTYERAVANGLDIPSKPATGAEQWVNQRHQLDRRATSAIQGLLAPEERTIFDRAFIGVMGVDLGTGVDKSNYPPGFLGP